MCLDRFSRDDLVCHDVSDCEGKASGFLSINKTRGPTYSRFHAQLRILNTKICVYLVKEKKLLNILGYPFRYSMLRLKCILKSRSEPSSSF